jgi:hypothetical protein
MSVTLKVGNQIPCSGAWFDEPRFRLKVRQ